MLSPKIIITILFSITLINIINSTKVCYDDIGCFTTTGPLKQTKLLPESRDKIDIKFIAYTSESPEEEQEVTPDLSEDQDIINIEKPLVFVIHGYNNTGKTKELVHLKDSLLKYGQIGTVIIVDWGNGAQPPNFPQAAANTQLVGHQVTYFVNSLIKSLGLEPKNVHLIGFSLGAQISGFAGKNSKSKYQWTYGRISGLDPAQPFFEGFPGSHLTKDDADFVDVIHTSAGKDTKKGEFGFTQPIGHIDFYPHNGKHQPRCKDQSDIWCNHLSAILYYDSSLSNADQYQCTAYKCPNWEEFIHKKCNKRGDSRMGFYSITKPGRGVHYLQVSKDEPFCEN
ncbi:pancreatic triacylglycerol lipase-like [Oppia nitens]|uniref:pancreatic triacylglycerol lipase-like n=1 Tax=Oppia nitens TaxID=1686743 RepID=UPI0023DB4DB4|nr:pancreatic triacylglycerol lipase-like [Oppia nitens]